MLFCLVKVLAHKRGIINPPNFTVFWHPSLLGYNIDNNVLNYSKDKEGKKIRTYDKISQNISSSFTNINFLK